MKATWHEAVHRAYTAASPLGTEVVSLTEAIGRLCAEPVTAALAIPHYSSAAMDGWAVAGPPPWRAVASPSLAHGEAVPIVTGAAVPAGATAILRYEHASLIAGVLDTDHPPAVGRHIRLAGEETAAGEIVVDALTRLNPVHISVAAGCGRDDLVVFVRARVAILLTGDEVLERGVPGPGRVRDSFGPQLPTVISMLGGIAASSIRIPDVLENTVAAIRSADAHVIVTTGGTGRSSADFIRPALDALGARVLVDGIDMRPGGPTLLAQLPDGRFLVGLPGNPLAAMLGLLTVAAPLLAGLEGANPPARRTIRVTHFEGNRTTTLVPFVHTDGMAGPVQRIGSGMLRGLASADGVVLVPPGGLEADGTAEAIPLPWTT